MGAACAHVDLMDTALASLDQDACYRAVLTRDARFDGRFFGGVTSTGIYCRPVCPARTPRRENMIFYPTAAAAEEAGFRACLRCRPETAPEMGAWRGTSNTVSRALSLIEAGALDGHGPDGADVETLAGRLGVGERQLRRLFRQHLGAAPISVAQTRRVLLAKQLIHETDLPMAQVALASGFGSVRRFNETFQSLYGRSPSELRRRRETPGATGVRLGLSYREPYDREAMLAMLAARGDAVEGGRWSRALSPEIDGAEGLVTAAFGRPGRVEITVEASDIRILPAVLARVRRVFDLSADPEAVAQDLGQDWRLAPLVAARPGLRLPGQWSDDGADAPSDRLDAAFDAPGLAPVLARMEAWRPWRAYGLLHLRGAGMTAGDLQHDVERDDEKHAA